MRIPSSRPSRAKSRDVPLFAGSNLSRLRSTWTVLGLTASALLLAACGKEQVLRPAAGKSLPVKPATAPTQPQPANLFAVPPQSRPGRSDELLNRSTDRPDDKFDLPPR